MDCIYHIDTEFHVYSQRPKWFGFTIPFTKGVPVIDLISIGIVCERTGAELYCISKEFDLDDAWADEWLQKNVLMPIYMELANRYAETKDMAYVKGDVKQRLAFLLSIFGMTREEIREEIELFVREDDYFPQDDFKFKPMGWYCDFDWVAFTQLWGGNFKDLPKWCPSYMYDLKQLADDLGMGKINIPQEDEHNALADARWNQQVYRLLKRIDCDDEEVINRNKNKVLKVVQNLLTKLASQADHTATSIKDEEDNKVVSLRIPNDIWVNSYENIINAKGFLDLDNTTNAYLESLTKFIRK
jgi:3' exoribonuclease, RNase T-like